MLTWDDVLGDDPKRGRLKGAAAAVKRLLGGSQPIAERGARRPLRRATREEVAQNVKDAALTAASIASEPIGMAVDAWDFGKALGTGDKARAGLALAGLGLPFVGGRLLAKAGDAGADAVSGGARAADDVPVRTPIRAFHGSPHDFDRFSLERVGTGEGAQAYGHGLYFSQGEDVARKYRDTLAGTTYSTAHGTPAEAARTLVRNLRGINDMASQQGLSKMPHPDVSAAARAVALDEAARASDIAAADRWRAVADEVANVPPDLPSGRMYEVSINADPAEMLSWDDVLADQPVVMDRLTRAGAVEDGYVFTPEGAKLAEEVTGEDLYRVYSSTQGADVASRLARRAGIPGIRYLDAGSRAAGEGTSNYVVFDDRLIDILRKYGMIGPVASPALLSAAYRQPDAEAERGSDDRAPRDLKRQQAQRRLRGIPQPTTPPR